MTKTKTPTRFVVMGAGRFPIDMLRYDACWPASSEDARKITESIVESVTHATDEQPRVWQETTEIALTIAPGYSDPTFDRWASFGWMVKT